MESLDGKILSLALQFWREYWPAVMVFPIGEFVIHPSFKWYYTRKARLEREAWEARIGTRVRDLWR
jgi:hypothetical protein